MVQRGIGIGISRPHWNKTSFPSSADVGVGRAAGLQTGRYELVFIRSEFRSAPVRRGCTGQGTTTSGTFSKHRRNTWFAEPNCARAKCRRTWCASRRRFRCTQRLCSFFFSFFFFFPFPSDIKQENNRGWNSVPSAIEVSNYGLCTCVSTRLVNL